jgi:phage tail-like protein
MPALSRKDPLLRFNFAVEIDSLVAGGFQEVTGLQSELEVQDYREGGRNEYIHKFWGPVKYSSNLVLKHGMTDVRGLFQWYWDVMHGIVERKNVSVILLDSAGHEKFRWNFIKAYPVKWVGPEFRSTADEVAVEAVELVHRGLLKAG